MPVSLLIYIAQYELSVDIVLWDAMYRFFLLQIFELDGDDVIDYAK